MRLLKWAGPAVLTGGILLVDQVTKTRVAATLNLYESWAPVPALQDIFTITYTQNTGAAFSMLPQGRLLFTVLAIIATLVIGGIYFRLPDGTWSLRLALSIILGGVLGNLIDRVRLGYVVDFLHIHGLPIFNVADIALVGGAGLLLLITYVQERRANSPASDTDPDGSDLSI
jgi:signal peptidase II